MAPPSDTAPKGANRMLTGYRVLDFTQFVAGPTCTRIMAELGAEVIKIELPPGGDRGRSSGLRPIDPDLRTSSISTYFFQHNHSKKSLALDVKTPKGLEIFLEIVRRSDVLVENFSPGVMARMGLGYEDLKAVNPGLVMCSISLAGQSGPLSGQPGFDYMGAAYAGITAAIGEADRGPAQLPIAIGDSATGVAAAMAVGFALLHRERTGEGQYIESTLLDSYFAMHEVNLPKVSIRGADALPERSGSQHPDGGPTGVFRAGDGGFVAIMVMPYQWPQMVAAMARPELAEDPRFATPRDRRAHREALKDEIEAWLAGFPTREAALEALRENRVPSAPVLDLAEAREHPHLRERGTVRRVEDPRLGAFDVPGLPVRFSEWPQAADLKADLLGEHNEEILRDLAGLDDETIAELYEQAVLARDPHL